MGREYDAIVAGASFAGLAAARQLDARVLLMDRKDVGSGQTSACGTMLGLVKKLGCGSAVLQTFRRVVFHTDIGEHAIRIKNPYCTIDYEKFCKSMLRKCSAEFLKAGARGVKGGTVITDRGSFSAQCIADCTGWSAVLANSVRNGYANRRKMMAGVETVADYADDAMRFFIKPGGDDVYAWIFPVGAQSRMGVAKYDGGKNLLPSLKKFMAGYGLKPGKLHGNFIPCVLREPVVENIFVAGDAAGQALPLSGEGIRKALELGVCCGKAMQRVIDGSATFENAAGGYRKAALGTERGYRTLLAAQSIIGSLSGERIDSILKMMELPFASALIERSYLNV